ncbi:unnamed protein product [Boreogadus saida]
MRLLMFGLSSAQEQKGREHVKNEGEWSGSNRPLVLRPLVLRPLVLRPLVLRPLVLRPLVLRPLLFHIRLNIGAQRLENILTRTDVLIWPGHQSEAVTSAAKLGYNKRLTQLLQRRFRSIYENRRQGHSDGEETLWSTDGAPEAPLPGGRTLMLPSQAARVQSSARTPCSPAARRSVPRLQPQLTPPLHIDPSSMETRTRGASDLFFRASDPPLHGPGPEELLTSSLEPQTPPSMVLDQRSF